VEWLKNRKKVIQMVVDVAFGFLGSGKTTFITKVMQAWGSDEKIVVLVNEFGDVGIDGELLASQGGDVVEMPSGCICCTLQSDFRNQIFEIERSFHPDRIIIEPSGVATISTIDWILKAQTLEPVIDKINKILIVDATGFKSLYKANRRFIEAQVEGAHLVVLNKCDRVDKRTAMLTQSAISSINPDVMVLATEFAAVDWQEYQQALSNAYLAGVSTPVRPRTDSALGGEPDLISESADPSKEKIIPHISQFQETEDALGYESFGNVYENQVFDPEKLESFFQDLNTIESGLGEVVRAKGIFCVGKRWIVMEQASGEISTQPIRPFQQSKITIIGKNLNRESINDALSRCGNATEDT
jgi:G3E family GTPase